MPVSTPTEASRTRVEAGYSLQRAAKLARVEPEYLRRVEKHGGASYVLAVRLSRLYRCSMQIFLYPHVQTTEGQPERLSPRRGRTTSRQVAGMQQKKTA
jgi:hypothetical protein